MSKHLQAAPVPPSARGTFTIPGELEAVVLSCLAKKPEDRPQSAAELALRLSAIDVEPWTDLQAKDWWLATRPTLEPAEDAEVTRLQPAASGEEETKAG